MPDEPQLCWIYRRKGQSGDSYLVCQIIDDPLSGLVMHVINGAWNLAEFDDKAGMSGLVKDYDLLGFVWGFVTYDEDGAGLDSDDALQRFQAGERADPTTCLCCRGTGRVTPDKLTQLTMRTLVSEPS